MTLRRRPTGRRPRAARRKTSWENLAFNIISVAATQTLSVQNLTPEPMQTTHVGVGTATLRRMLLHVDYSFQLGATDDTMQFFSIGIAVVSRDAIVAGAVPDPESDFNQDWYYWTRRGVKVQSITAPGMFMFDVDIRSARRLRGGYALYMGVEFPVGNADPLRVHLSMRNLWTQEA